MKKYYLLVALLGLSQLYAQTVTQTIPATLGANSTLRAPNGTTSHTTIRAHYMIYPADLAALPSGAQIISAGFVYLNGVNTAANGNLKFYLENSTTTTNTKSTTWATAITGMDTLYDASYAIPVSVGATTSTFTLLDTFTYAGNGIQVAYDYLGTTFATTAAAYDCNNSVAGDLKMVATTTTTPGTILNASSSWRPGLNITYVNPFTNDVEVTTLRLDKGHHNNVLDTNQSVVGSVTNNSVGALTSVAVTLDVTGANPSTATQTIASLAAGATQTVTFSGLSTATAGNQTIKLSVPSDQFTNNDSIMLSQDVSCDTLAYIDNSVPYTAIGYNTGQGILAAKHSNTSSQNITVNSVFGVLDGNTNIAGNRLQAVLIDTGGVIIDSSSVVVVATGQLGTTVVFPLTGTNVITAANPDFYIGIRQYADTVTGYFPLSSFNPANPVTDRFYGFNFAGGGITAPFTTLGSLGIGAIIEVEQITLANSDANDSICAGESVTFTASGTSSPMYDFKAGGTSVQNSAALTYAATINSTTTITVEGMYNNCPIMSNPSTIVVTVPDTTVTKVDDSTATSNATSSTFQWIDCNSGLPVPGATSQTFVASVSGDYKVAIDINGCVDTSKCYSFIVPVTSLEENKIEGLAVFPSPADNMLTVKTDNAPLVSITILDASGKLVGNYTPQSTQVNLNISSLSSGVYLIKIETEKGSETKRFIKN